MKTLICWISREWRSSFIGGMLMMYTTVLLRKCLPVHRTREGVARTMAGIKLKEANSRNRSRICAVLPVDCCLVCRSHNGSMVLVTTHPLRLLIYVLATFTLLIQPPLRSGDVEEILGLLIAAFVLWLLGQITFDMTVNESSAKSLKR